LTAAMQAQAVENRLLSKPGKSDNDS